MEEILKLRQGEIISVSTKYYYKYNVLHFTILLNYSTGISKIYKEYDTYENYLKDHKTLTNALNRENEDFPSYSVSLKN